MIIGTRFTNLVVTNKLVCWNEPSITSGAFSIVLNLAKVSDNTVLLMISHLPKRD